MPLCSSTINGIDHDKLALPLTDTDTGFVCKLHDEKRVISGWDGQLVDVQYIEPGCKMQGLSGQ
jgi:hypothetical protein